MVIKGKKERGGGERDPQEKTDSEFVFLNFLKRLAGGEGERGVRGKG